MKDVNLQAKIVELRIMLQNLCDGFSLDEANKKNMLSMDKKVLFMLSSNKDCAPSVLIETLGVAKSNLALLCKSMVNEGTISVSKSETDKRNVFYNITELGKTKLNEFYLNLEKETTKGLTEKEQKLAEKKLEELIEIFNKRK